MSVYRTIGPLVEGCPYFEKISAFLDSSVLPHCLEPLIFLPNIKNFLLLFYHSLYVEKNSPYFVIH